jgi:hypothetical protein
MLLADRQEHVRTIVKPVMFSDTLPGERHSYQLLDALENDEIRYIKQHSAFHFHCIAAAGS